MDFAFKESLCPLSDKKQTLLLFVKKKKDTLHRYTYVFPEAEMEHSYREHAQQLYYRNIIVHDSGLILKPKLVTAVM